MVSNIRFLHPRYYHTTEVVLYRIWRGPVKFGVEGVIRQFVLEVLQCHTNHAVNQIEDSQFPNQMNAELIASDNATDVGAELNYVEAIFGPMRYASTQKHDTPRSGLDSVRVARNPEFELGSGRRAGKRVAVSRFFSFTLKIFISISNLISLA